MGIFPFFSLINLSKALSRAILINVVSKESILLFCLWLRYTILSTLWKDSKNMLVLTITTIEQALEHAISVAIR